jgi:hypothetical protein
MTLNVDAIYETTTTAPVDVDELDSINDFLEGWNGGAFTLADDDSQQLYVTLDIPGTADSSTERVAHAVEAAAVVEVALASAAERHWRLFRLTLNDPPADRRPAAA